MILVYPDYTSPLVLDNNISVVSTEAVLSQQQKGEGGEGKSLVLQDDVCRGI